MLSAPELLPSGRPASGRPPLQPFLDELLAEQQRLQTPAALYARTHDDGATAIPDLEPVYRHLIPLSAPGPSEQYAFEVDLDACSGCKACVAGCHSLNGLDDDETWRDVGLLVGGTAEQPYQQTVTSACHHCADPGCLNGCPVLAYEKDPLTGIVRHLDDQCIGCSYCILKCPYDVPKFSRRLGIVRKCDLCHGRLAAGEAPACVQACPTHAIRIVTVAVATLPGRRARVDTSAFLAGAPDPNRTQPTTRYVSKYPRPKNARPADAAHLRPQPMHLPLVLMLLLTQIAVGLQLGGVIVQGTPLLHSGAGLSAPVTAYASAWLAGWLPPRLHEWLGAQALAGAAIDWLLAATLVAAAGLLASIFHLGRPLRAWRIFLGWRRSWLSREAMVFGGWFAVALPGWLLPIPMELAVITTALGILGVFCSAMIYIDTGRRAWCGPATAVRFAGTTLGTAALAVSPLVAAVVWAMKLALEFALLPRAPMITRQVMARPLYRFTVARVQSAFLGIALLLLVPGTGSGALICGLACLLVGEVLERVLYFRAVDPSRMPGLPAS